MDANLSEPIIEEVAVISKEEKARLALKDELPDYVVESFMATGYDTLEVIAKMDTTRTPGNSLEEVEQYISMEFLEDHRFRRGITSRGNFKFLPGHRQRIVNFVEKVKKMDQEEKEKRLSLKRSIGNAPSKQIKKAKPIQIPV